jgi:hypothetical protein
MIDIQQKKQKIISHLKINGPSLPVRIAKSIEMDPVFASAILSELINEKKIKISHMKIGSSPLYLLPGQEQKLENLTENLKPIEQDALSKLKEKKLITDENEEPAIRVALRNIKDFATPFKFQEKIMWSYAFTPKEEIEKILSSTKTKPKPTKPESEKPEILKAWKEKTPIIQKSSISIEPIFKKPKINNKTFLKEIEEFLEKQNTKIISIEEVDKKRVIAKIKSESQLSLLFAFNKKRITEKELIKCYKKAKISNLPYHIITSGDPTKKMSETVDAYKKLIKIDKLKKAEQ